MEKHQQAEQSKQRSQQKQRDMLRERQECLDKAWNRGHPWDTNCLWSSSGVRTGVLSPRGNIVYSSEMLMHTKSGRKPISGGNSWQDF